MGEQKNHIHLSEDIGIEKCKRESEYKYKLIIAYDGTNYSGWQLQKNASSIQEHIQNALSTVLRCKTQLCGAGRTDRGVHAIGQCAHFTHTTLLSCEKILLSLNGLLPKDIRILHIASAPSTFHARYSAKRKIYHYHLYLDRMRDLFKIRYAYFVPYPIDVALLAQTASLFVGMHDFTSFTNRGGNNQTYVRTLHRVEVVSEPGGIRIEFEGDGFLYRMVRNMIGVLLDVCRGRIKPSELLSLFLAKDRRVIGQAAPGHALFLQKIIY